MARRVTKANREVDLFCIRMEAGLSRPPTLSPSGCQRSCAVFGVSLSYGRGGGVGRARGVGLNRGVGVGLGVAVDDGVAVAVGVGVDDGVDVTVALGLGVGVGVPVPSSLRQTPSPRVPANK